VFFSSFFLLLPPFFLLCFFPPLLLPSWDPAVWALRFFTVHWVCFARLHSSASDKDCEEGSRGCRKQVTSGTLQTALKCVCNLARRTDSPCAEGALESRFKVIRTRGWEGRGMERQDAQFPYISMSLLSFLPSVSPAAHYKAFLY